MLRRILIGIAVLLAVGVAWNWSTLRSVWRATHPSSVHETEPVALPAELGSPALLLFTKTNGFRHEEGIPAGVALIEAIAKRRGWSVFHTESGAVFTPENLARFSAVIWHQVSGDVLNEAQQGRIEELDRGGRRLGRRARRGRRRRLRLALVRGRAGRRAVHRPPDGPAVPGREGRGRGPRAPGHGAAARELRAQRGVVLLREEPAREGGPRPRDGGRVHLLAAPEDARHGPRPAHGRRSPRGLVALPGKGRVFYSALGHQAAAYALPEMEHLLEGAIAWAARLEGAGCDR